MYTKNCPTCGEIQTYASKKGLKVAVKKNTECKLCSNKGEKLFEELLYKNCPTCGEVQTYTSKKGLNTAIKKNTECSSCVNTGEKNPMFKKPVSEKTRELIRIANTGKKRSEAAKEKYRNNFLGEKNPMYGKKGELCPNFGREWTNESKEKLSNLRKGVPLSEDHRKNISLAQIGTKHSEETKRKMRISRINNIIENNGGVKPSINKRSFEYFSTLEKENSWNGLFGFKNYEYHIKELGYFIDYYEPNLNIVVEYDEVPHYNIDNSLKEKDIVRMGQIKEYLKCKFFRYNERTQELKEY